MLVMILILIVPNTLSKFLYLQKVSLIFEVNHINWMLHNINLLPEIQIFRYRFINHLALNNPLLDIGVS